MTKPSYIAYYAEPLPHGRAILHCDVVVDGKLEQSYDVGSPAPLATVKAAESKLMLKAGDGDAG
jgi:hypothetical protein